MTEDEALFLAAVANPAEMTPALALADWFDEHDEPSLATALRTVPELVPFLHELMRWDQVPCARIYSHEAGAFREAWNLLPAAQLLVRYRHLFPTTPETPRTFVPGAPPARKYGDALNTAAFLGNWQHYRQRQIAALREQVAQRASRWTSSQRISSRIPDGVDAFEWKSCLIHELVLRDRTPGGRAVAEHVAAMHERGHPLAWLPLGRHAIEAGMNPSHAAWGGAVLSPVPPGMPNLGPAVLGAVAADRESRVFAAVRSWQVESNGNLEAVELELSGPLDINRHGVDWFRAVPAQQFAPVSGDDLSLSRLTSRDALSLLYGAAITGGAYSRSEHGVYSRLHAWESFSSLAGCSTTWIVEGVAAQAEQCEWLSFSSDWFFDIAWDLGIICIRPDRRSVAILAASDTD